MISSIVFYSLSGFSAQTFQIKNDGTPVFYRPNEDAEILLTLSEGVVVRGSSRPKDGFYKILIPKKLRTVESGKFGWVLETRLVIGGSDQELRTAGFQKSPVQKSVSLRHLFELSLFGQGFMSKPSDAQTLLGAPSEFNFGFGFGGEFGYFFAEDWAFGVRILRHQFSQSYTDTSGGSQSIEFSGTNLIGWIEYLFMHTFPWRMGISLGGGASISTTGTFTVASGQSTFAGMVWILRGKFRYLFTENIGITAAIGYRLLNESAGLISNLGTANVNLSSPFVDLGMSFEF